jgi:hypothetical protein
MLHLARMNRILGSLTLLLLLLGNHLLQLNEVTRFFLHRSEIAQTLCVERDNPNNCCQGTCQLTQRVRGLSVPDEAPLEAPNPVLSLAVASVVAEPQKVFRWAAIWAALCEAWFKALGLRPALA